MSPTTPLWIDTQPALAEAAAGWSRQTVLAIDTEFVRERTFFAILGLVQISDGETCFLVDPVTLTELEPLRQVFADPSILKVAHSPSEDMEVLFHRLGEFPRPLFDTQRAAALAGLDPSMSYQRLISELVGVELPKGVTRSDWVRRPLTPEQTEYAGHDVEYLLPAYRVLRQRLEPLGRTDWVLEDSRRLQNEGRFLPEPEEAYLRLGGIGSLRRTELEAARRLAEWREQQARQRDLPRNFVLKEATLLDVVRRNPTTLDELAAIDGIGARSVRRIGPTILGLLEAAAAIPVADLPARRRRLPRTDTVKATSARLQALVQDRATDLGIEPQALASRRDQRQLLLATINGEAPPPPFDGWRWAVFGPEVEEVLEALGA